MSEIRLTTGEVVLVDDEDYVMMSQFVWRKMVSGKLTYAIRYEGKTAFLMHRAILGAEKGIVVDHRNGNGLDNRKSNLRSCTHQENMRNRQIYGTGSSQYKGVYWDRNDNHGFSNFVLAWL